MDSLEPRLKRCRSCGACSESMDKCQTCKNKYKIKWSVSFNFHIFNRCACFISSKWPGSSKTWMLLVVYFVSLRCCPYTGISDIFNIFNCRLYTYVFIALLAFKQIHQFVYPGHYFYNSVTWPTFHKHHNVVRVVRIKHVISFESSAHQSLYFSGTTAANHAKLLIGRATKNIISL